MIMSIQFGKMKYIITYSRYCNTTIIQEFEWTLQTPLNPSESIKIEVYDEQTIGKNR